MSGRFWTPDNTAEAVRLWHAGRSATEIAVRLGAVSRQVVCGKLFRLGLRRSEEEVSASRGRKGVPRPRPGSEPRPRRELAEPCANVRAVAVNTRTGQVMTLGPVRGLPKDQAPPDQLTPLEALTPWSCRRPYGHVGSPGFGFCGARKEPGDSYCAACKPEMYAGFGNGAPDALSRIAKRVSL